jgi:hypothetical protein
MQPKPTGQAEREALPGAAGFWRRMTGFVVDVFLCFVLPSLVSSLVLLASGYSSRTRIIDAGWVLFLALIIVGYFAYFTLRGPSPGMRLASIKILSTRSGETPAVAQAVIRGLLMLCLIGSWFVVVLLGSGRAGSGGLSNAESLALNVGYVLFLVSAFGHVWISWDRKGQTVQDKLAGIVVVRKDAVIEPVEQPKTRRIDPLEYRM